MDGGTLGLVCSITSIASAALGFLISFLTFNRNKKKDDTAEGQSKGVMLSEIGYIKAGIDDLKRESAETRKTITEYGERLTRVEESAKQAHKRIDGMEAREH